MSTRRAMSIGRAVSIGGMMSSNSRSPRSRQLIAATAAALVVVFVAGACGDSGGGSESGEPAPGEPAAAAALESGRTVIDVRTPEEFEAGHVEQAALIDIQGPDFSTEIAGLDTDDEYVVYCRSGNRSAVAAAQMAEIGLDVTDGGGLDDMVAAGWPRAG